MKRKVKRPKRSMQYRFISENGKRRTRWRPMSKTSWLDHPTKRQKKHLGKGYGVQIVGLVPDCYYYCSDW